MTNSADHEPGAANQPEGAPASGRAEPGPPAPGTNQAADETVTPESDRTAEDTGVGRDTPNTPGVYSARGNPQLPETTALAAPGRPDGEVDPRG